MCNEVGVPQQISIAQVLEKEEIVHDDVMKWKYIPSYWPFV